tara:strand:- start:3104 stop:4429 length:1326 start_codon:yes stop_codon:yes gene_type:complete
MIVDIVMPKMGESITEGTILEWRKEIGDIVELDEILLEIGTDKVDSEIPSSVSGTVVEILAKPNDVIDVGKVIARINSDKKNTGLKENQKDELVNEKQVSEKNNTEDNKKKRSFTNAQPLKAVEEPVLNNAGEIQKKRFYTPIVMKIAMEKEISLNELERINGSGNSGRVTKKDILDYIENNTLTNQEPSIAKTSKVLSPPSLKPSHTEEMPKMRRLIADHMRASLDTSAHVYLMTEVDMTKIVNFVKNSEKPFSVREEFNLTYTPFIVDAVVKALMDYPQMNASLYDENTIQYHKNINIGLAVAIKDGLMVPSIFNCEEKNFLGLCRSINDIAARTRNNQLSVDELSGSTFSITNFGVFGMSFGTPIINQPNVGILGVGAIKKEPVVIESEGVDAIAIRSIMKLSLGFDHRLIDGAGGSKFLNKIKLNLESLNKDVLGGL